MFNNVAEPHRSILEAFVPECPSRDFHLTVTMLRLIEGVERTSDKLQRLRDLQLAFDGDNSPRAFIEGREKAKKLLEDLERRYCLVQDGAWYIERQGDSYTLNTPDRRKVLTEGWIKGIGWEEELREAMAKLK
jgi:hypothetical protein